MKTYFGFSLLPLCAYLLFIVDAHGGNDKAPILVLAAALFSLLVCAGYLLAAVGSGNRKENLKKAAFSALPFAVTIMLFGLARMEVIDTLPILGFR